MFILPEPKTFCFCINLKIGAFIIGIFALFGSILNILTWVTGVRGAQLTQLLYQLYHYDLDECDEDCKSFVRILVIWVFVVVLVLDSLHIIMASLLIHGIRKEQPRLFVPFLSWQVTRLIVSLILFIVLVVVFRMHIVLIFSFITVIFLMWTLDLYFFLVIYAYKMELCRAQGTAPLQLLN